MEKITAPWGPRESVSLDLPKGWRLREILEPQAPASVPLLAEELDRAMRAPIGLPALHEFARGKKSAAVVVDDRTRPTPVSAILPRVWSELAAAGVPESAVVVVIATGTHRDMTPEEIQVRLGADFAARFRVIAHHHRDHAANVRVGTTPTHGVPCAMNREVVAAELVVSIGCIEAHEQAGVGGGYKNLMPGVAGLETIRFTHHPKYQDPPRVSSSGMPKRICKFRQAVDECGALLGPKVYIVNTVMVREQVIAVVAGDPLLAHAEGRALYEALARVRPSGPAEVVITGARPLDLDLRLTLKACFNAAAALKPGGLMICVSHTPDGLGDLRLPKLPTWAKTVARNIPKSLRAPLALRVNASPDQAAGAMSLLRMIQDRTELFFLSSIPHVPAFENLGLRFFTDPTELLEAAIALKPEAEVTVLPQGGASFVAWEGSGSSQ